MENKVQVEQVDIDAVWGWYDNSTADLSGEHLKELGRLVARCRIEAERAAPPSADARELLAREYERDGFVQDAQRIRDKVYNQTLDRRCLRAIQAALDQRAPSGGEELREAVAKIIAPGDSVGWKSLDKADRVIAMISSFVQDAALATAGTGSGGVEEKLGRFGHHPDAAIDYECEIDALIGMAYERLTMGGHADLEDRINKAMNFQVLSRPGELRWLSQVFCGTREIYARKPDWVKWPEDKLIALQPTPETSEAGRAEVERVAMAITQEIGWGSFSHFEPEDVRRISRAAIAALTAARAALAPPPDQL